ncbi:MAG: hypothetical protein H7338_12020 [Candidatus Sericytochromatia bacterium]|nr:hypothetical protein [Candidatus Sericytochromatia bacterium]
MSYIGNSSGNAQPGFYPPQPNQQGQAGYGYQAAPQAYTTDAYRQGYQSGGQFASPYAGQVANTGNSMTSGSNDLFGMFNGLFSGVSNMLGGLVNSVSGIFGGGGGQQATHNGYPQQGYPQQPMAGNSQVYMQNVIPPPPERMNAQNNPMARFQAIAGDLQRQPVRSPQQGMGLIASHSQRAEAYRKQAESLFSRARSEMRSAVSACQSAARSGNATQFAEAAGKRQSAFDTFRQATEVMGAVYDESIAAQITYNLTFGPYGALRGADGNASFPLLQSARAQWEGGKASNSWFSANVTPPYQRCTQTYQEMDRGMQQMAALGMR